jgi:acyl-CoA dehydrogenase
MSQKPQPFSAYNHVLLTWHRSSPNFYSSDLILRDHLKSTLPAGAFSYLEPLLGQLGMQAAGPMNALSLAADQNVPQLIKRDAWGEPLDEIRFHPAYWDLMKIAVESQMLRLKWEPTLRKQFAGTRHKMGFALGMLYAMSESGQYCPLCMTDGVAHLIDQFCAPADRDRLLPHIYSKDVSDFYTGAMFLTEKAGGSDVGANLTEAKSVGGDQYALHGEKWFCSNVNAQIIFALARTQADVLGTRGLSIFLVERTLEDGSRNPLEIVRLKDKLGTRSMASGECLLQGTIGTRVGPEFQGFKVMSEMINLSRMYNSVAAVAGGRRALIEAWQFLNHRQSFGKVAVEHSLVRAKLWELGSLHMANFGLLWRAIQAMDRAEEGDQGEIELLRLLTPMVKRASAEAAVYICRESMELMGGMGYVEDTVLPKTMRDVMVLPIWEGAGNIMVLDMLRASTKSKGLAVLLIEIETICKCGHPQAMRIVQKARNLEAQLQGLGDVEQDAREFQSKSLFIALTHCYQSALLLQNACLPEARGASLALEWFLSSEQDTDARWSPPTGSEIADLIGWEH